MSASYPIGRVLGIPVQAHITLLIFLPLLSVHIAGLMPGASLFWGIVGALGLFFSVAFHELGHSVMALVYGIRTREILLLPIGGLAQLERMPEDPGAEMRIAFAGPAASLALAFLFRLPVWFFGGPGAGALLVLFYLLSVINFMLALFNLLPSFPMDGGRIFRAWLSPRIGRVAATRIAAKTGRGMAIALGVLGLLTMNFIMIVIAIFVYQAAGAEYRAVVAQDRRSHPFGPFTPPPPAAAAEDDDTVIVSPPPYARQRPDPASWWRKFVKRQREVFERLFDEFH